MKRLIWLLLFIPAIAQAQYSKFQTCLLQDAQGRAIANAQVYVLTQPTSGTLTPLATVYGDSTGSAGPLVQPVLTNGFGECTVYAAAGTYTVVYVSPYIGTKTVPDVIFGGGGGPGSGITAITASAPSGSPLGASVGGTASVPNVNVTLATSGTGAVAVTAATGGIANNTNCIAGDGSGNIVSSSGPCGSGTGIQLTTTGTSGAATLNTGTSPATLNIPIYSGSGPNATVTFTNATTVSMPYSTYLFMTNGIITSCYDPSGNKIEPQNTDVVLVAANQYSVTFTFAVAASGTCVANSGGGGSSSGSVTVTANQGVAGNSAGLISSLPEVETSTTSGVTSFVCQEDHSNGIFDPRCITYAGGVNGSTPAAAWQAVFNQAACWTVANTIGGQIVGGATIKMPPGIWNIGTNAAPSLIGGPGVAYIGSPSGNGLAPISMGGTTFISTYQHVPTFEVVSPFYMACTGDVAANVTSISIASNVATVTASNSYAVGTVGSFSGVTAGALWFLNAQNTAYTITAANSTSFQFAVTSANVAATAQSGAIFQQVHADSAYGGAVTNISVGGCGNKSCSTITGDPNTAGETANETGIFIGLTHTSRIGPLSASYARGEGIKMSGNDVVVQGPLLTQSTATYWGNPDSGDTGAAVGFHAQVDLSSGDSRFFHVETYGAFVGPNTTTLGHVCAVALGGGNTMVDDVFVNIDQMGVCTSGTGQRLTHLRVDGSRGPALYDSGLNNTWDDIYADGYCLSSAFRFYPGYDPTGPGTCNGIMPNGGGPSTFSNVTLVRNFFDGETFAGTGDILQTPGGFISRYIFSVDTGNDPQIDTTYDGIGGTNIGQNVVLQPLDLALPTGKGIVVTGATPNIFGHRHIEMKNTSATSVTDLQGPLLGIDYKITLDSSNDVLVSTGSGGKFITCSGSNVTGPKMVEFTAIQTKLASVGGNSFQENCN